MALSGMSGKEKAVVAALGAIIVVALVGIGILGAKLLTDGGDGQTTNITVPPETPMQAVAPEEAATLVTNPSLEGEPATPPPAGAQPVAVAKIESASPLLPTILTDLALYPGRQYRVEIAAVDGSKTAIRGSWSHSAKGADGKLEMPLPETIEGTTPLSLDLVSPLANAVSWSVSVSASPRDLLAQPPRLAITIWDVTGSQ